MANNIQVVKDLILSNLDEGTIITPELHREVENAIVGLVPPGPFVFEIVAAGNITDPTKQKAEGDTIQDPRFVGWDVISVSPGNGHYTAPYFQKQLDEDTITMRQGIAFYENVNPKTFVTVVLGIINNEV